MDNHAKKRVILCLGAVLVMAIGSYFFVVRHHQPTTVQLQTSGEDGMPFVTTRDDRYGTVTVYVTGCVGRPGMLQVSKGSRVENVIDAAGGLTQGADVDRVNLAAKVKDGQHIHVPAVKEKQQRSIQKRGEGTPMTTTGSDHGIRGDRMASVGQVTTKVNINVASAQELDNLPDVGKVIAERIVQYRNEHGRFHSTDELSKVPGLTHSRMNRIRPLITVD